VRRREDGSRARWPSADGLTAALEDGDVERVDLHLHEDLRVFARTGRCECGRREHSALCDLGLTDEALERPVAAFLDQRRDGGERYQRAELPATALELERGDVVLDAIVVAREGRGAQQVDRAVGPMRPAQAATGCVLTTKAATSAAAPAMNRLIPCPPSGIGRMAV
jgi:hypothetical protein